MNLIAVFLAKISIDYLLAFIIFLAKSIFSLVAASLTIMCLGS